MEDTLNTYRLVLVIDGHTFYSDEVQAYSGAVALTALGYDHTVIERYSRRLEIRQDNLWLTV